MLSLNKWISLGIFLLSYQLEAYRFTCNSMDADGYVEDDSCGSCINTNAPRWKKGFEIPVYVDTRTLPNGLSSHNWQQLVINSFAAWNHVPNTQVRLVYKGESVKRNFGGGTGEHEIFWVLDKEEWRKKVGGGENSVMGVTIAPYSCPTVERPWREIEDADLIMNGVGSFAWYENCRGENNCASIFGTLNHELGHFLGLGHPCVDCNWSLMSATNAFNIERPVFDDMEGLRVLYPGNTSPSLASPCDDTHVCEEGLSCVRHDDNQYCSNSCTTTEDCQNGMVCDGSERGSFCKFPTGSLAKGAELGDSCQYWPCKEGLTCTGMDAAHLYCYAKCAEGSSCYSGEVCLPLDRGSEGICMRLASAGEKCDYKNPCEKGAMCVVDAHEMGVCHSTCLANRNMGCDRGQVCLKTKSQVGVCMPEGTDRNLFNAGEEGIKQALPYKTGCTIYGVSGEGKWDTGSVFLIILGGYLIYCRRSVKKSL